MSSLEGYLLEDLYGRSVFSDLCLLFFHPNYPFSMRFSIHKAMIAQSSFFRDLLLTKEIINKENPTLSIDLKEAWTRCGFAINNTISKEKTEESNQASSPLLASHISNVLEWFYCVNKQDLLTRILNDNNKNILNILSLAILFDIPELADACVVRYINTMDLECITHDIHLICQFPQQHLAYCKLRDSILLILFRHGPFHVSKLAKLPMDYLERVLSADSLFVMNEFDRYYLLKSLLHIVAPPSTMELNNNKDKNTVTTNSHHLEMLPFLEKYQYMTTFEARNRKRKRRNSNDSLDGLDVKRTKITSDDDDDDDDNEDDGGGGGGVGSSNDLENNNEINLLDNKIRYRKEKTRRGGKELATTTYTFEPSIWSDKSQSLKKLLKTAINYSSMTFAQLSVVRQDRIVDEGIVFRALWQRESLERIIFPSSYNLAPSQPPPPPTANTLILHQDRLLNTPKYRFSTSIFITSPKDDSKWRCETTPIEQKDQSLIEDERKEGGPFFEDSDDDNGDDNINCNNNNNNNNNNGNNNNSKNHSMTVDKSTKVYKQTFHSQVERVLGAFYRVELEAEVIIPYNKHTAYHSRNKLKKPEEEEADDDNNDNSQLTCKFKLQPTRNVNRTNSQLNTSKLNYWIYCLNKYDKKEEKDGVLKAVTEKKTEVSHCYNVMIPMDFENMMKIDVSVAIQALEFDLQKG